MSLALHQAASSGQVQTVTQLLAEGAVVKGAVVNAADAWGRTPLQVAAGMGHADVVQLLLAEGAIVNAADARGKTPLYVAAEMGHTNVVPMLLAAGADANAASAAGAAPLYIAATGGHTQVVELLLAAGANVDAVGPQQETPLFSAVVYGWTETAQLLLRKGANPQLRDYIGNTAINPAALRGQTGIVQLLLEAWGQPQIRAADLITAAENAAFGAHGNMATFARLAKELRQLYPAYFCKKQRLFGPAGSFQPILTAIAMEAMIGEWASDVNSLDEQRAAVRRREEDVASEKQAVQQLIVRLAGMARHAQRDRDRAYVPGLPGLAGKESWPGDATQEISRL